MAGFNMRRGEEGRREGQAEGPISVWPRLLAVDAVSGAFACLAADVVMHPVDTVKARLQAQHDRKYTGMVHCFRKIVEREGARRGLYAGLSAVLLGGIPANALLFSAYQGSKRLSTAYIGESSAATDFGSGAVGEIAGLAAYVPSEVVAKRMQISGMGPGRYYKSTPHAIRVIYRTEGLRGLYSGGVPTMIRDVPFTALQFMFFETLKRWYQRMARPDGAQTGLEVGAIGLVAGGGAALLTTPFDVVKTRLQTQAPGGELYYTGTFNCLSQTLRMEGFRALWRGGGARVLWVAPASAITLAVYEKTVDLLNTMWAARQPSQPVQPCAGLVTTSILDRRRV